jgi:hypothetical protein
VCGKIVLRGAPHVVDGNVESDTPAPRSAQRFDNERAGTL